MELGDVVEAALARLGVTTERVERWLGKCRCRERKEKLNALSAWARQVVTGDTEKAREYLDRIIAD